MCIILIIISYGILSSNDLINLIDQLIWEDCITLSLNLNSANLKRAVQTIYVGYKFIDTCIIQIVIYEIIYLILSNDRIMSFE